MENEEQFFELNYLFEDKKDIFQSLKNVEALYHTLHDFDRLVIKHIFKESNVEYILVDLEYSSFKTKVEQIIKSIPDELLKKPDIKTLVGILLIKLKYWLLKKLNDDNEITTKEQIIEISDKINEEIKKISKDSELLTTEISNYSVLDVVADLSIKANNLKENESLEYKSQFGNALLHRGKNVNKQKILVELGSKTERSETTEIIKPKKIDLLNSESSWNCIMNGKSVSIKILDTDWLEKYHKQIENVLSGDSLKVKLLTTYIYNSETPKTNITYEVLKVEKIIKPDSKNEQSLL